jgi:hypothetical protein
MRRRDVAGAHELDLRRDRRSVRVELARLETRELAPAILVEPELVAGALLVDVEPRAADQLVQELRRRILVQLRDPLRGEDRGEPALPALRAEERDRLEGLRLAALRGEEVRLVDHDEDRPPERAREIHQLHKEEPHELPALVDVQVVQIEHGRRARARRAAGRAAAPSSASPGRRPPSRRARSRSARAAWRTRPPDRAPGAAPGRASARAAAGSRATSRRRCSPG